MPKSKLQEIGVSTSVDTKLCTTFLGAEHNGLKTFGLDDEEDGTMFDSKYDEIKSSLPNAFIMWLEDTRGRKRSLLRAMKTCMLKPVRTAAGLGVLQINGRATEQKAFVAS